MVFFDLPPIFTCSISTAIQIVPLELQTFLNDLSVQKVGASHPSKLCLDARDAANITLNWKHLNNTKLKNIILVLYNV